MSHGSLKKAKITCSHWIHSLNMLVYVLFELSSDTKHN
uniref:Uncharacterized protein n=1 Tax=Arundo donax TaxID=35708 RepID=A0A0A8ZKZ4_ARUDO